LSQTLKNAAESGTRRIRVWRWIPAILLLLLLATPAFPPLINIALQEGLKAAGFTGSWRSSGGYLLTSLVLNDVRLQGNGLKAEALQVRLSYNLLRLLKRELPLRIQAKNGLAQLNWDDVLPKGPAVPPRPVSLLVEELKLDNVQVALEEGKRAPIPNLLVKISGKGPSYQVTVDLPDGQVVATLKRTGREFEAWQMEATGDVRAGRYWYDGLLGGQFQGHWVLGPKGILGQNQIKGGKVKILNFVLSDVYGPVEFDGRRVTANLVGSGLGGPVKGSATVDIDSKNPEYRFRVEGTPTLTGLAESFALQLPVRGSGPLVLEGRGWENLILKGRFNGTGELLGERLDYEGALSFDRQFNLDAVADGALLDRTFQARINLENQSYKVNLQDSFGSKLRLSGVGADTAGGGMLVLPKPLLGQARLSFASVGPRWNIGVSAPGVTLPLAKPFDLSGGLSGQATSVQGQLGNLKLGGTWDDLRLKLEDLEMVVGSLSGQGSLKGGRVSADLNYDSLYARFPITVRQEKQAWKISNAYASGLYQSGVFSLKVEDLPLQLGQGFKLRGDMRYDGALSGGWNLKSPNIRLNGELYELATRYTGEVSTPLGNLPVSGVADSQGVRAKLQTLDITADNEGLRLAGPLELGFIKTQANLSLKASVFTGDIRFDTPYLSGVVEGRGSELWADADGYAQLSGPVWPTTFLRGRLSLPVSGAITLPKLPLEVTRDSIRLPQGNIQLKAGLPFKARIPLLVQGKEGSLEASGGIETGQLKLSTQYGVVEGRGPWKNLSLSGLIELAGYQGRLRGQADLTRAAYKIRLAIPKLEGELQAQGQAANLTYAGQFQNGKLNLAGEYKLVSRKLLEGLRLRAIATAYDLSQLGVPGVVSGNWSEQGGRLTLDSRYGQVVATGKELLGPLELSAQSQYGTVRGSVGLEEVNLQGDLKLPYISGNIAVRGPWNKLDASGSGRYRLPYLQGQSWRLQADVLEQTWKLVGPLELSGRGLEYAGRVQWPYEYQGRQAELAGTLRGEGLNVQADLATTYTGVPIQANISAKGADIAKLKANIAIPQGTIELKNQQASFDLETGTIAQIFKVEVAGRVSGTLDLEGKGEFQGNLLAYGEKLRLDYKDRVASAFLSERNVGAILELDGALPRLVGLGDLQGSLTLGEKLEGSLSYSIPAAEVRANIAGTRQRPEFVFSADGSWGKAEGEGAYNLAQSRLFANLNLDTPYVRGQLNVSANGSKYQAEGNLKSLQYLEQSGIARLEGEGTRWSLNWAAPMAVEARGRGLNPQQIRLVGKGLVRAAQGDFYLNGDLSLLGQDLSGRMAVLADQINLNVYGQGRNLALRGQAYGAEVDARTNLKGELTGKLAYKRDIYSNRLSAEAVLSGTVFQPVVEGSGTFAGKGAEIALRFGYDGQAWVGADGAGIKAEYKDQIISLQVNTDLKPFSGVPVRLKTQGKGSWESLELPFSLSGPDLSATGTAIPARQVVRLSGQYQKQQLLLQYDKLLQATFNGPYVTGTARWQDGGPKGFLTLDVPIPGGRLGGTANLDQGQIDLSGSEGWRGLVKASLKEGWSKPTQWQVQADLRGQVGFKGQFDLQASPLAVTGNGQLSVPEWGQVQLVARGNQIELKGGEGVEPLTGTVQLDPLQVAWSYVGELPKNLGRLEARGRYPGIWLTGKHQIIGQTFNLEGKDTRLLVSGKGLGATLTTSGLEADLNRYALGPAILSGKLNGPWNALNLGLAWEAFGRQGQMDGTWQQNVLKANLSGDLAGSLLYGKTWDGNLKFREGTLNLGGEGIIPTLEGSVQGLVVKLKYPLLQVSSQPVSGGLQLNLSQRTASGEMGYRNIEVRGAGPKLEAVYPFAGGRIRGEVDLQTFDAALSAPELGRGALKYSQGKLSGDMTLVAYGLDVALQGQQDQLNLKATHPALEWLPWKEATLSGNITLDGIWNLQYADAQSKQQIQIDGKLLEAKLTARGPWLEGNLAYNTGWTGQLNLDLPITPLSSRLTLALEGRTALFAKGQVQGGVGRVDLSATLGKDGPRAKASFRDLVINEVPFLNTRIPYLTGRANGEFDYSLGSAAFSLQSPELKVQGDEVPLSTSVSGTLQDGILAAKLSFGQVQATQLPDKGQLGPGTSTAILRLENGILSGEANASAFPLHWLFSAWVGNLEGKAYWTGKTSFSYNTRNPWASKGVFIGEYLRFSGGGDELLGKAVLRFEQERLYFDQLDLFGKGTWHGEGYLGRAGSNFRLNLENTSFTPVLQVIPNLKPYLPEGSGTVRLSSTGQAFDLELDNFNFKLGPVRVETPGAWLRVANTATAEGKIKLTAPYPAEAYLSGEGKLGEFTVRLKGTADVPLLSPKEPFEASFSFPSYVLDARLVNQEARLNGTLFPSLALALVGPIPVSYPQYFLQEGLVDANLTLKFERGVYQMGGSADVLRARLGLPEGQKEVTLAVPQDTTPGTGRIPLEFFNVQIRAERGILIQESLAQGELAGEVYLNGEANNPYLSGEVVPIRGSFKLWDRDFTVRSQLPSTVPSEFRDRLQGRTLSTMSFNPSDGILPQILILADTQVLNRADNRLTQVYLALQGQFVRQNGKTKINLEPILAAQSDGTALTEAQIYALLLLGRSDLSALPADIAQSGIQAAVQSFVLGQLERELAKAFGLDQVRVEAPILSGGTIEETKFTIGKYLSPDFYLGYSVDLRGYQTIFGEYQQGDYSLRFTTDISASPRPEFTFGYSIQPIGADLSINIATGVGNDQRRDGVRFGIGLNFRF